MHFIFPGTNRIQFLSTDPEAGAEINTEDLVATRYTHISAGGAILVRLGSSSERRCGRGAAIAGQAKMRYTEMFDAMMCLAQALLSLHQVMMRP